MPTPAHTEAAPTEDSFQPREIRPYTDRKRVRFEHFITVQAAAEKIFPLLCPVREFDWIPHWDCEVVYTESGVAERGCVFRTEKPGEGLDTWVVCHYEPSTRISFVRVDSMRTILFDIFLEPVSGEDGGGDATKLTWIQEITALDDEGDRFVAEQEASDFATMIESIEAMLQHFLRHGEPLRDLA